MLALYLALGGYMHKHIHPPVLYHSYEVLEWIPPRIPPLRVYLGPFPIYPVSTLETKERLRARWTGNWFVEFFRMSWRRGGRDQFASLRGSTSHNLVLRRNDKAAKRCATNPLQRYISCSRQGQGFWKCRLWDMEACNVESALQFG